MVTLPHGFITITLKMSCDRLILVAVALYFAISFLGCWAFFVSGYLLDNGL